MAGQDHGGSGQPPSRINLSTSATDRLQKGSVSSILTEAFSGGHDWVSLARIIAGQLRSPGLDWRDLARGLEQVRQRGTISGANQLLDRVAILAMHLAAPGEEHIVQSASAEMLEACGPGCGPECMLRTVLPILRRQVPFDVATYAEYHYKSDRPEDPVLVQARFAVDGDDEFHWPARWLEVPSSLIAWAAGKQRWIVDIDDFFKERADAAALREHPVMREYTKRDITSFVVVRYMDGERLTATLTLGRRRGEAMQPFSRSDQNRLDALRLEAVLRRVCDGFEARTTALRQQIAALFRRGADPNAIAAETVRLLGTTYGWEYVAVFRVNRARGLFEVVAEHDPTGQLAVGLDYTQPLNAGMLGAVLRCGEPLNADNVRTHPPPFGYISSRDAQMSAMCFPVRIHHH
ncbi:hypothetical protein, partial [Vineibacter terrae]|uniref:GAF domain-containing protein n=1 Tax=Vineibacter terrae TaxID=2586908 RepID=UPI002E336747